jgi:prefoldin subunit 5
MFVSKKEHDELKKQVEKQNQILKQMSFHLNQVTSELEELKKPKEPNYFS